VWSEQREFASFAKVAGVAHRLWYKSPIPTRSYVQLVCNQCVVRTAVNLSTILLSVTFLCEWGVGNKTHHHAYVRDFHNNDVTVSKKVLAPLTSLHTRYSTYCTPCVLYVRDFHNNDVTVSKKSSGAIDVTSHPVQYLL